MRVELPEQGATENTPMGELTVKDFQVMRWPSGKIFIRYLYADLLQTLANEMRANIMEGFDNMIVIDGAEGSGKSNLAWQLCHLYDNRFCFDDYAYNAEGFKKIVRQNLKNRTVWMDEGSNIANNREWNSQGNRGVVLYLETMRSKGNTFVMCIPVRDRLDIYIRENRIRYVLHCEPMEFTHGGKKARGYFELRKRGPNGNLDLVGYGEYDPMPDDVKAEYEELKARSQETITKKILDEDKESNGARYKEMYESKCKDMDSVMLALYDSGYDRDGLMQLFGIENKKTFSNRISKARART